MANEQEGEDGQNPKDEPANLSGENDLEIVQVSFHRNAFDMQSQLSCLGGFPNKISLKMRQKVSKKGQTRRKYIVVFGGHCTTKVENPGEFEARVGAGLEMICGISLLFLGPSFGCVGVGRCWMELRFLVCFLDMKLLLLKEQQLVRFTQR